MSFTSSYGTNVGIGVVNNVSGINVGLNQVTTSSSGQYVAGIKATGQSGDGSANDIFVSSDFGRTFSVREPINNDRWGIIKYSGNGQYLYATGVFTNIHRSSNYGLTFQPPIANSDRITDVAVSYTGQYVYISLINASLLLYSNNFGMNFFPANPYLTSGITFMNAQTHNVACSSDGKYVVVGVTDGSFNTNNRQAIDSQLLYSNNNGTTFSKSIIKITNNDVDYADVSDNGLRGSLYNTNDICISSNGKYVSFIVANATGVFISKDFGQTFKQKQNGLPSGLQGMTMSYTGQYITCIKQINTETSNLYTSNDVGDTWTTTTINTYSGSGLASSASGQFLALIGRPSQTLPPAATYIRNLYNYSYTPIRISYENKFNFTFTSTTGGFLDSSGTYYLKNKDLQILSTVTVDVSSTNSITFTDISTNTFDYGMSNVVIHKKDEYGSDIDIVVSDLMVINATCFLEGTKILAMDKKFKPKYIPIEKLKPGMFVKTLHAGFVPIKYIGYSIIYNPGLTTCVRDQLFKCTKSAYPELTEDLVLTGNHSILVDTITDEEREQITETLGGIYVTERKYRLPAFNDKRAVPYEYQGDFRIWNLALENDDYYENYGIYANGLLVETTSCRYLKEISGMTLVE